MDQKLTLDILNGLPKEAFILLIMSMQVQLTALNSKIDDLFELIKVAYNQRYEHSTEKLEQYFRKCSLIRMETLKNGDVYYFSVNPDYLY